MINIILTNINLISQCAEKQYVKDIKDLLGLQIFLIKLNIHQKFIQRIIRPNPLILQNQNFPLLSEFFQNNPILIQNGNLLTYQKAALMINNNDILNEINQLIENNHEFSEYIRPYQQKILNIERQKNNLQFHPDVK